MHDYPVYSSQVFLPTVLHIYFLQNNLSLSEPLQPSQITVENILITRESPLIRILPESMKFPSRGQRPHRAPIPCQNQGACSSKCSTIPRAGLPPIRRGVDHRISTGLAVILVHETMDPRYHCGCGHTVARGARGVVFDI
jgi:hypothetical protein